VSAREHDESKVALDIEAAYLHKLAKHEPAIMAREDARHRRRLQALGPGSSVEDPDFPGCFVDEAPYPDLGDAA
jgi:hypothetical protein